MMSSKPEPATTTRFATFAAFCAEHQAECSEVVRALSVGSAIILAIVAFMMQALNAHPLPQMSAQLIGSAAYGGFDAMAWPTLAAPQDQPPVDADAIISGMLLAVTLITAGFALLGVLTEATFRFGAIAHRLGTARKLPEAEGGD